MDQRKVPKRKSEEISTDELNSDDPIQTSQVEETAHTEEEDQFVLKEKRSRFIKKYKGCETAYAVKLNERSLGTSSSDANSTVMNMFQKLIEKSSENLNDRDLIRVCINSKVLDNPISTHLMKVSEMSPEKIVSQIEKVSQSGKEINVDDTLSIDVVTVKVPIGKGRTSVSNLKLSTSSKKSVISIINKDDLCCARAIVVGMADLNKDPKRKQICDHRIKLQKTLALELHNNAGVPIGPCGFPEIKKFAEYLKVQINVVDAGCFNEIVYRGSSCDKKIYLWLQENHYHTITSMKGFLGKSYYCEPCDKGYSKVSDHHCKNKCLTCFSDACILIPDCNKTKRKTCPDCNKPCRSLECFKRHKEVGRKKKSFCDQRGLCLSCLSYFEKKIPHVCGQSKCRNCKQLVILAEHLCYITQKTLDITNDLYIFFDFEAQQDTEFHEINLAIAQYLDGTEFIFKGPNALQQFGDFLFSKKHKKFTAIAHNMQGYDGMFLLLYIINQSVKPQVIMNGSKILYIKHPKFNVRVIDSFSFLPMALSKMPRTFGLDELKKGYFPHLFNTSKNDAYIGELPDPCFYNPEMMSTSDRLKFDDWYKQRKLQLFDFSKELVEYCRSDVDILRRCCLNFRNEFMEITRLDPFQYITIASACMAVYRTNHFIDNTIAVVPVQGYVRNINTSKGCIQWLNYLEYKTGQFLDHYSRGSGEVKVEGIFVDGYDKKTKTVYQYTGCFFHGCSKCYNEAMIHPLYHKPMSALLEDTEVRKRQLEEAGYSVEIMWEHEFENLKETDPQLKKFLSTFHCVSRLNPRNAFYGGRTGVSKMYHKIDKNETIKYIDYTSLYPYVNKYSSYPVGHPKIITNNFGQISEYFGMVMCTVLPPSHLFHPVLPYRSKNKLIFGLCRECIDNRQTSTCTHIESERCLTGTWTTIEVIKALEMGYTLKAIHEVYHFENQSSDLFKGYINTFLKIKQEASGYPSDIISEVEKNQYLNDYESFENIKLNPANINSNPGRRAVAKLMLNSFWGKFGQNDDKLQTVFVSSVEKFNGYFADQKVVIKNSAFPTKEIAILQYEYKKDCLKQNFQTNIFMAAFTTAYARLKLYNELNDLNRKVLYYDTDSIIYISNGDADPPLGNYLGQFTDEVPGDYITEFVSAGPKNYAFKTASGNTTCKIRGFTLNHKNSQLLNFESLKDIVQVSDKKTIVTVNNYKIKRDLKKVKILSCKEEKKYAFNFDKRVIRENYLTFPYGYL